MLYINTIFLVCKQKQENNNVYKCTGHKTYIDTIPGFTRYRHNIHHVEVYNQIVFKSIKIIQLLLSFLLFHLYEQAKI